MHKIHPGLYIGGLRACRQSQRRDFAVIHACKHPCHRRAVGYRGSLPESHPNYLVKRSGRHLYLNMIDPPLPLFKLPLFVASLDFIDEHLDNSEVLIHCNKGYSRAPSIALVYLSKRAGVLDCPSYANAKSDFLNLFPLYSPAQGIRSYLAVHWDEIQ